jgi:hypothetical protein
LLVLQRLGERLHDRLAGCLFQAEHARRGLRDEARLRNRREFHQPGPVRVSRQRVGGNLQAKARLSGAPGASECEQAVPCQQCLDLVDLFLAPDEAGQLLRQVIRMR